MKDRHSKDTWTVFKIMAEFVEGFETLRPVWPSVSVFGGSRIQKESPYYQEAIRIAEALSNAGFSVITGGGPGIMEAANLGASRGASRSIGLSIRLPHEQFTNEYADLVIDFNFFFARKVMFVKYASGFVGLPGGFGTLDEIFEALTLVQTQKVRGFPVILYGKEFWQGLVDWLHDQPIHHRVISPKDLSLLHVTDDIDEIVELISSYHARRGSKYDPEDQTP